MRTTRIRFEEIKYKAVRRWVDEEGKKRQQTRVFSQTINPFNKKKDGTLKTASDIRSEILIEATAWLKLAP